jgi:hypothetical protein
MTVDPTRLTDALAAEHAAIFAYGVIGARLDDDQADAAREAEETHRSRRDALLLRFAERGVPAPPAAATYELPFAVDDADAARRLAVLVEERVAAVWRSVLPAVAGPDRAGALDALVDAATRATGWRRAAGVEPATVAFPGAP